jgi:acyl carrier protein
MEAIAGVSNGEKLRQLVMDVLLLDDNEYSIDLRREEVETWDSLGVVSIAVGIDEVFGYHPTPEEATGIHSVTDIIDLLVSKGIEVND